MTWIPCRMCGQIPCMCSNTDDCVDSSADTWTIGGPLSSIKDDDDHFYFSVFINDVRQRESDNLLLFLSKQNVSVTEVLDNVVIFSSPVLPDLEAWKTNNLPVQNISETPSTLR